MKRFISFLTIILLVCFTSNVYATKYFVKSDLNTGLAGSLDEIDGADIADGDRTIVMTTLGVYYYICDGSSGKTESVPTVISPEVNAGTKRWHLNSVGEINAGAFGDIASTVAAIDDTECVMVVSSDFTLTANLTIPSTLTLKIVHGGTITFGAYNIDASRCPEFKGAPGCFIYNSTGVITGLKYAIPRWWGENTTPGTTDMTSKIQACVNAARTTDIPLETHYVTSVISIPSNRIIMGHGDASCIKAASAATHNIFQNAKINDDVGDYDENITIKDLTIDQNLTDTGTTEVWMGLVLVSTKNVLVENVKFLNPNADCIYISTQYAGVGLHSKQPENIKIKKCDFIGGNYNRNGISVISGDDIFIDGCLFDKMTRSNMPGAIDLEPNSSGQYIRNVNITNCIFTNCKHAFGSWFSSATQDQIDGINVSDITVDTTPEQTGSFEPWGEVECTQGFGFARCKNVNITNAVVKDAGTCGVSFEDVQHLNISNLVIENPNLHGAVFRDCQHVTLSNFQITLKNDTYESLGAHGIDLRYRDPLVDHIGVRDIKISNGTIRQESATSVSCFGLIGYGNVHDLYMTNVHFSGNWNTAVYEDDASDGDPQNWNCDYSIESGITVANLNYDTAVTVNGVWNVPGYTYGRIAMGGSGTKNVTTPFAMTGTSVFQVARASTGTGLPYYEILTKGTLKLRSTDASEAGTFVWRLIQP